MADDGMLLNFSIGAEPLKAPQAKFKGGRWRDRKRAERTAKGVPERTRSSANEVEVGERAYKRQRTDEDGGAESRFRPRHDNNHYRGDGHQGHHRGGGHGAEGKKTNGQVVSRLFSFNPAQKTARDEEQEEWKAPEPTNAPLSDVANFGTLEINARLVSELGRMSLERPTAIQKKVVPHMLSSSGDAFVQAETGSGKTFAYLLPMLHRVLQLSGGRGNKKQVHRDSGIFGIVVAPTRELARQTHNVLEQLIRPFPWLVSTSITGGESKKAEKARIRKGVNFLVATPGRLADHIDNTKALNLGTVRWLILDEGDRLMDLGFEEDLKKAIGALKNVEIAQHTPDGTPLDTMPDRRVTVLCSATMKMNVQKLGEMSLADATFLAADKGDEDVAMPAEDAVLKAPAQLHQSHIIVPSKLRLVTLISYLRSVFSKRGKTMKVIIFLSCADTVDFHFEMLRDPGKTETPAAKDKELVAKTVAHAAYLTSAASPEVVLHRMHGSLTQPVRTGTLKAFSACKLPSVLVTTDVSSRGLDIPSVDLVIEYDPAFSFSDHIHRVGRTARAGRSGEAVLFLLPGTEEGYISLFDGSSVPPTAQSYEDVLRRGLLTKMEFPAETSAKPAEGQASSHDRAEALQLHLEQRLLAEPRQLELARAGFRSHVRAYATHVKEERRHFDITELHLGHVAKSFALREPPGGIGNGIDKKAKRGSGAKGGRGKKDDAGGAAADDDDGEGRGRSDMPDGYQIFKAKSRKLMASAADEFNIG